MPPRPATRLAFPTRLALPTLLALAALVPACGDDPAPVDATPLCALYRAACERQAACGVYLYSNTADVDACLAELDCAGTAASMAAADVTISTADATACTAAITAASCAELAPWQDGRPASFITGTPACAAPLVGGRAAGESCAASEQCQGDLTCQGQTCPGTCAVDASQCQRDACPAVAVPSHTADITLFDAAGQTLAGETWRSKGGNCPFIGHCLPGQVRYTLKTPYRDGTTHIVLEPLDFIARLAALVPPPRMHLTRYHGVFAPHSRLRAAITPAPMAAPCTVRQTISCSIEAASAPPTDAAT